MLAKLNDFENHGAAEGLGWHVAFCVNPSDQRSLDCLRNAAYEVYYPQIRERRPVGKRSLSAKQRQSPITVFESVLVPFWPRYFFIHFSLRDGQWHDLFKIAHIRGLMCDDDGSNLVPALVNDSIIAGIKAMEINGGIPAAVTTKQIAFSIGENVRITGGAFTGHNGIVDRLPDVPIERLDDTARLSLLVALFGGARVPVELPLGDIAKL